MLDERVRGVLARLEAEDGGSPAVPVTPATGRFLFALVAPQTDCEVLEVGAGRGYSSVWLAAGVRHLGGRLLSLERDAATAASWRRNMVDAGLDEWAELVEGDALETLPPIDDVFDAVFLDAAKDEYERYFELARAKLEPGGLVVADNVLSHEGTLGAYSRARRDDPTLESVTLPLDRGLELTVVLTEPLHSGYHGKEVVRR
ncbi:MAG TPA: class I SAM-dependent methyltransferase [Gaiellaceae bacterium]|nr:class I SAM-dependent methyltransferase [Gaiellaceae bacterium]